MCLCEYNFFFGRKQASGFSIILGDAVEESVENAYDAGIVVIAAAGTMDKMMMAMYHLLEL